MKKKVPRPRTDEQAEAFLAQDLSKLDFSQFKTARFEFERKDEQIVSKDGYFCQECYWGAFSRSYILPVAVDATKADASLKNGILTIAIPKQEKTKTRVLKVKSE